MSMNSVEEQAPKPETRAKSKWELVQGFLWLFLAPVSSVAMTIGKLGGFWPALSWWLVVGPVALWATFFAAVVVAFVAWAIIANLQSR